MAESRLQPEDGGQFGADALEFEQHPPGRRWRGGLWRGEQRVALGLGLLDLIKQQVEPIEFAPDLGLEMHRQGMAITRSRLVEPFTTIAAQRLVTGDALGKQQYLDAIDVLDPLGDQHFALAAEPG